ncbi:MAG: DUF721 domain-containing protein [Candidatus Zixiibacteriota bacterium]
MYRRNRPPDKGKARGKAPKPIAGAIENAVKSLGISKSYHGWLVVTQWPEIVGERIAGRTRAFRFDDGTLYVAAPDAAWRQELAMQTDELMQKIHSYPYGRVVKQLRFVQGEKG